MRIPRWLVVTLLSVSVLALLAAGVGAWRIIWPDSTAKKFVALMRDGKLAEASEMLTFDPTWATVVAISNVDGWKEYPCVAEPVTIFDVLHARRTYRIRFMHPPSDATLVAAGSTIYVELNRETYPPADVFPRAVRRFDWSDVAKRP
jgi:hypothetical protein